LSRERATEQQKDKGPTGQLAAGLRKRSPL
jgi:hypothetical protein